MMRQPSCPVCGTETVILSYPACHQKQDKRHSLRQFGVHWTVACPACDWRHTSQAAFFNNLHEPAQIILR